MCFKKKKKAVFYWDQLFFVCWVDQPFTQTLLMLLMHTVTCVTQTICPFQ